MTVGLVVERFVACKVGLQGNIDILDTLAGELWEAAEHDRRKMRRMCACLAIFAREFVEAAEREEE